MDNINKLLGAVAIGAAALTIGYVTTVKAADLGGHCCADLEERTAELEATTARKGNRKMSLTVYGQVNQAVLWVDSPEVSKKSIVNNTNSQGRFGFVGEAKISPGWAAGYLLEVGTAGPPVEGGSSPPYALSIRHSALWVRADNIGTVWLGKTSTATDGIAEINVSNADVASTVLSFEPLSGAYGAPTLPYDGNREEVLKFTTASFAGFTASAAWFGNKNDAWDIALRWKGEGAGFRGAAGIGYRNENDGITTVNAKTLAGSASAMHIASGIFLTAGYGDLRGSVFTLPATFTDIRAAHVQAGIEQKWAPLGITTLYAEVGRIKADGGQSDYWGFGAVQKIDAAAMDVYLSFRSYDKDLFDARVVTAGGIIRF